MSLRHIAPDSLTPTLFSSILIMELALKTSFDNVFKEHISSQTFLLIWLWIIILHVFVLQVRLTAEVLVLVSCAVKFVVGIYEMRSQGSISKSFVGSVIPLPRSLAQGSRIFHSEKRPPLYKKPTRIHCA